MTLKKKPRLRVEPQFTTERPVKFLKAENNYGFLLTFIMVCSFAMWAVRAQAVTSKPVPKFPSMFPIWDSDKKTSTGTTGSKSLFLDSFKSANTSPTKYDLVTLSAPVNVPRVKNQDYRKRKETVNHYVWPKNDIIMCPIGETYIDATYGCRLQKHLNDPCRFSKQCYSLVPNSVCDYPSNNDDIKRCICPQNSITNSRIFRDYCFSTNVCSLPNSAQVFNRCSENEICLDGICQCLEGYYWNINHVCTPESFYKLEEVKSTSTAKSAIITSVPTSITPANVDHSTHSEGSTISTRVAYKTTENSLLVDRNPAKLMNCTKELEKVKKERVVEENSDCILSKNQLFILIITISLVVVIVIAFIIIYDRIKQCRSRENNERPNQENAETELGLMTPNA